MYLSVLSLVFRAMTNHTRLPEATSLIIIRSTPVGGPDGIMLDSWAKLNRRLGGPRG